jgi:hypothetical protein
MQSWLRFQTGLTINNWKDHPIRIKWVAFSQIRVINNRIAELRLFWVIIAHQQCKIEYKSANRPVISQISDGGLGSWGDSGYPRKPESPGYKCRLLRSLSVFYDWRYRHLQSGFTNGNRSMFAPVSSPFHLWMEASWLQLTKISQNFFIKKAGRVRCQKWQWIKARINIQFFGCG